MPDRALRGLAALLCAVALLAAKPAPKPTPSPTLAPKPTASPAAAPAVTTSANVIVYPFDVGGDLKANIGVSVAQIFDQQMSGPGLVILPTPQNVKTADFLKTAQSLKADYYVTGYLTPVGDAAALVVRIVDTSSGLMISSRTTQINSATDAATQASLSRSTILAYTSGIQEQLAQQSAATPEPQQSPSQGASMNLGGLLNVFKHSSKNGASSNTGVSEAQKPPRIAMVGRVDGAVNGGELTTATAVLGQSLNKFFKTEVTSVSTANIPKAADLTCGTNRDATIVGGLLTQQQVGKFRGHTESTFTLRVYTCFGALLYEGKPHTANSVSAAVEAAVAAYANDHPQNS